MPRAEIKYSSLTHTMKGWVVENHTTLYPYRRGDEKPTTLDQNVKCAYSSGGLAPRKHTITAGSLAYPISYGPNTLYVCPDDINNFPTAALVLEHFLKRASEKIVPESVIVKLEGE